MKRAPLFTLVALILSLSLSACGFGTFEDLGSLLSREQQDVVELPDDCVVVSFPDDTGADDYGEREQAFYHDLERALQNRQEKVLLRNALPLEEMSIHNLDHGVFWLKSLAVGNMQWFQTKSDEEKTSYQYYEFEYYDLSDQEIEDMKREIDKAADEILAKVPEGADMWTTSLVIHDELCKTITYDSTVELPHTHDLYGALVNHEAVCSAYSVAFHFLMDKTGFYNQMAYSETHAWNFVNARSYDEYIDTTWDDTDLTDRNGNPYIFHDYFFLKREEVESIDDHVIASGDPYTEFVDEIVPYNYHAHEGYLAESYDLDAIADMFQRQFDAGANVLTVRFAHAEDYQSALSWQEGNSDINDLLWSIGYESSFYFWSNDKVNVINIGLYPAE